MKTRVMKWGMQAGLLALRVLPLLYAVDASAQIKVTPPFTDIGELRAGILCKIADWTFTFAVAVSIILVLFAAFNYLTSGGNEEKVGKANQALIYIAVGVAVAVLAKGIPAIVGSIVGRGSDLQGVCS